jgi:beta-lactamase regulating signal transducer with metallopeptidase domain
MYPYLNIHPGDGQLLQAFSWMLIHSLWQGVLLAVSTAAILQVTKRATSVLRYNIVFAHFIVFILACTLTFAREMNGNPSQAIMPLATTLGHNASTLLNVDVAGLQLWAANCAGYISAYAHLLVLLWALCFSFRSFRMVQGHIYLQKAKRVQVYAVTADWQQRLTRLSRQLHITTPVRLMESGYVKVPIVIGHLKPLILMPAGLLTGLPVEQVEAVLLHELAHIRRHDYIVNLLQTICESVFFFNPGLRWMAALLRNERENCCDDIALQQTGNKYEFIQALISFKEYAISANYAAVAFPGRKNQLLHRVSRIINNKHQPLGTGEKVFFIAGIIILCAMLSAAAITQIRNREQQSTSAVQRPAAMYEPPTSVAVQPDKGNTPVTPVRSSPARTKPAKRSTSIPPASTKSNVIPAATETATMEDNIMQPENRHEATTPPDVAERAAQLDISELATRQREQARLERIQAERDRERAIQDRIQGEKDRIQAERDREQANRDRAQADKDRAQARLDRLRADKDRQQAENDRKQYQKDRELFIKEKASANQAATKDRTLRRQHPVQRISRESAVYADRYEETYRGQQQQ